nr:hypothetical protein [Nanoarchaeum sp.]
MINLAGVKEADEHIQEELYSAGIEIVRGELSKSEVPHSITGKLGDWKFNRAWYYWTTSAQSGKGLPLEIATMMHEREYPIIGEKQPKNYGQVIRVAGHCNCPHPRELALPNNESLDKWSKETGIDWMQISYGELAKLCNNGTIQASRFVNYYHIDNQLGLNEFARVLRGI